MIRGGGGAEWLVAGLSLLRSQLQITISEQFNIPHNTPHQAVSRQIVSSTRAGMLITGHLSSWTHDIRPIVLKMFVH